MLAVPIMITVAKLARAKNTNFYFVFKKNNGRHSITPIFFVILADKLAPTLLCRLCLPFFDSEPRQSEKQ